jgi:serine phosphatase RsbU (regulator of sigma subunit)
MVFTRIKHHWRRLSLLQQLLLSLWLCSVPMNVFGSYVVWRHVYERVRNTTLTDIEQDLGMVNQVVNDWVGDNHDYLEFLATSSSIERLDLPSTRQILARSSRVYPNFNLAIFTTDGRLLASNDASPPSMAPEAERRRRGSDWFQEALAGRSSLGLWRRGGTGLICISQAVPIRRANRVLGVLQSCTPVNEVAARSGITQIVSHPRSEASATRWMNPLQGRFSGWGYLLVAGDGQAVLLHQPGISAIAGQTDQVVARDQVTQPAWRRLINTIQAMALPKGSTTSATLPDYYLVAADVQDRFRLAVVVDHETSLGRLRQLTLAVVGANLLALLVSSVAIARICRLLLRPIHQVEEAMQQLSQGQFEIQLVGGPNTEIDDLFRHINSSADRLRTYVDDATRHAVTRAQVSEAKRMQADFLIEPLPPRQGLQLAALCQPAYDIGADWYDVVPLGDATAVVVADVCDKGIPSALYMSVFRSLLRLSLSKEWAASGDAVRCLGAALSNVNRYMASTHASSGMFATAFVGLYLPATGSFAYALAGHETPFVLRAPGAPSAPQLAMSGPALGLFEEAAFAIHSCSLRPGDLLFAYSDGLPDARSPAGEPFGRERIQDLLASVNPEGCSPQDLLAQVHATVTAYCGGAEPFDDLTLLTLKVDATG